MSQPLPSGFSGHAKRLQGAFFYSLAGLRAAYKHEAAFRLEALIAVVALPLALWLGASRAEKAAMCASVVLVVICEIFNSAIEATVDRISDERHELAGRAKDMGSAAVFVAACLASLVWLICLWP